METEEHGGSEGERLARIETHVLYIKDAIDKAPQKCKDHREPIEKSVKWFRYLIIALGFLVLGLLGHESGAMRAVISLMMAGTA